MVIQGDSESSKLTIHLILIALFSIHSEDFKYQVNQIFIYNRTDHIVTSLWDVRKLLYMGKGEEWQMKQGGNGMHCTCIYIYQK